MMWIWRLFWCFCTWHRFCAFFKEMQNRQRWLQTCQPSLKFQKFNFCSKAQAYICRSATNLPKWIFPNGSHQTDLPKWIPQNGSPQTDLPKWVSPNESTKTDLPETDLQTTSLDRQPNNHQRKPLKCPELPLFPIFFSITQTVLLEFRRKETNFWFSCCHQPEGFRRFSKRKVGIASWSRSWRLKNRA